MFQNRKHAALLLADTLKKYRGDNVVVAGIPRGGIETAYYVAQELHATLVSIIVRKLGHPRDPEYAFGAIAEDGTVYYNATRQIPISQEMIDEIEDKQLQEIENRKRIFRGSQPFPDIKDKTVIIVDDGIATGATIFAAIGMCKKRGAAKILVAAPICSKDTALELRQEADKVITLEEPKHFNSVSQFYKSFGDLTDMEALKYLELWKNKSFKKSY